MPGPDSYLIEGKQKVLGWRNPDMEKRYEQ